MVYNLKDFTKLVHMLAKKFNLSTVKVALRFKTSVSEKYVDLFLAAIVGGDNSPIKNDIDKLTQLIKEGLDVNVTSNPYYHLSLLMLAIEKRATPEIIKLLLDAGADPHYKDNTGRTVLSYAVNRGIQLIKEAMQSVVAHDAL